MWGSFAKEDVVSAKGKTALASVELTIHLVITLAFADIIQSHTNQCDIKTVIL